MNLMHRKNIGVGGGGAIFTREINNLKTSLGYELGW